jgi:hypothetical protein
MRVTRATLWLPLRDFSVTRSSNRLPLFIQRRTIEPPIPKTSEVQRNLSIEKKKQGVHPVGRI